MLRNSLPLNDAPFDDVLSLPQRIDRPSQLGANHKTWNGRAGRLDRPSDEASRPVVDISPSDSVKRRSMAFGGMTTEFVQSQGPEKIDFRFRGPRHLLVAYEQGVRRDGETFVEGLPRSTRRDLARRLTFVPAGHIYHEWHEPRVPVSLMYFYFDPAELQIQSVLDASGTSLKPQLFFEDTTLRDTVLKLKSLVESPTSENRFYFEALGVVLVHELVRLNSGAHSIKIPARGGLATWQQRIVSEYIDEHLADQVSLATLAQLVRLSPYHFCRAFKQSFGVPPHRYHTNRRIERAKTLLEKRPLSVTSIGLTLGFGETSSFTAAFRRATGVTPSAYHRSLA